MRVDPRLRERGFGSWEGLTTPEIEERFADSHRRWLAGEGSGADDAEPFEAFSARVERLPRRCAPARIPTRKSS